MGLHTKVMGLLVLYAHTHRSLVVDKHTDHTLFSHNAQCHRQTEGQMTVWCQQTIVRSA